MTPKELTKSTTGGREKTRTLRRRRGKAEANQMIIPTGGGALTVWKQTNKAVTSRSIAVRASTDPPTMKGTVPVMAGAQENILVTDPEAEKGQIQTGIGIITPKETDLGLENQDTTKMNHGDGRNADTTVIIIPPMEQGMVGRGSPLIVIKTMTN